MEKPISNKVLSLLEQYSFDQLSREQLSIVLSELSEEEYRAYQLLILETQSISAAQKLSAPSIVQSNIHNQLSDKFENKSSHLSRLLAISVPLWLLSLVVAGFGLLWYTSYSVYQDKKGESLEKTIIETVQSEPMYIYKTDTVYQEIIPEPIVITKEVIKIIEVEIPIDLSQEPVYVAGSQKEFGLVAAAGADLEDLNLNIESKLIADQKKGQSVSEEKALMDILDGIK